MGSSKNKSDVVLKKVDVAIVFYFLCERLENGRAGGTLLNSFGSSDE